MRQDDLKNPRTKNYSNLKYFLVVIERVVKKFLYLSLSILNFNISKKKSIFIGKYKDTRFIEFLFFSLSKEYNFVYQLDTGLSNFIKKIGVKNFLKFCKRGNASDCEFVIRIDDKSKNPKTKIINFNTDYFYLTDNDLGSDLVLPYYMYPKIYSKNYNQLEDFRSFHKEISIIFSGSTNKELYSRINWKDNDGELMLNRCEIIDIIEKNFSKNTEIINSYKKLKDLKFKKNKIYLFKNEKLENKKKSLLSQKEHITNIAKSEFFITAPGTEMPVCHHFIEAIKFGTIPITNYGDLILPRIDKNFFLQYSSKEELLKCILKALNMSDKEKENMRTNLIKVYDENFSPSSFLKKIKNINHSIEIYANNDHDSVRLREKRIGL